MTIWFTSDLHQAHKNIMKFCGRPFETVEEMNQSLTDGINAVVKPDDVLYHLGDLSFGHKKLPITEFINSLKCKLVLILGNHDEIIRDNQEYFLEMCPNIIEIVEERKRLKIDKIDITLDHYPARSWYKSPYGAWQLHGHTHGSMERLGRSVDVGWDSPHITGTPLHRPISFDELKEFMKDIEPAKEFKE